MMTKMEKSCLTCKFEPDWKEPTTIEFSFVVQYGKCKWKPQVPACVKIEKKVIRKFQDNSGIYKNCAVWEPK